MYEKDEKYCIADASRKIIGLIDSNAEYDLSYIYEEHDRTINNILKGMDLLGGLIV